MACGWVASCPSISFLAVLHLSASRWEGAPHDKREVCRTESPWEVSHLEAGFPGLVSLQSRQGMVGWCATHPIHHVMFAHQR